MIRRCILFLLIVLLFAGVSVADEVEQAKTLFYQANGYYSDGKFEDSVLAYEGVLELGYRSGPLYYNLGNAYFKNGEYGKAIANYKRALRLIPRDADLISNLKYVYSLVKGDDQFDGKGIVRKLFLNLVASFSLDSFTYIAFTLYIFSAVLLIAFIVFRRFKRVLGVSALVAIIALSIAILGFFEKYDQVRVCKLGIVIEEDVECNYEPVDEATKFFDLSEGDSVTIISQKGEWVKVRRGDGKQGWVRLAQLEVI